MKTKCNLLPVEDNMQSVGTAAFLQFLQPMRGISGTLMLGSQEPWNPFTVCCPTVGFSVGLSFEVCSHIICGRYVVASLDVTVFPANAERVKAAFDIISSVCSMSSSHCGWIMMPVHQAQTNQQALMKHRRHIEDSLVKASINLTSEVAILLQNRMELEMDEACPNLPGLGSTAATWEALLSWRPLRAKMPAWGLVNSSKSPISSDTIQNSAQGRQPVWSRLLGRNLVFFSPKDYIDNILQDLMYKLYTNYNVTIFAVHCSSRWGR